jgi:hypothetical protein
LNVLPTIKALELTMVRRCYNTCCEKKSKEDEPNGCQKENCFLNINFSNATFLVFETDYQLQIVYLSSSKKENTLFNTALVSGCFLAIWQPPENVG